MTIKLRHNLVTFISALLILLFVYTASSKLWEFQTFRQGLARSPLINNLDWPVAILIPAAEIIISSLLLIPATRLRGLYGSLGLMILFTLYISYMLLFAVRLPCGCGGVFKHMGWRQHWIFNLFIIGLTVTGIALSRKMKIGKPVGT